MVLPERPQQLKHMPRLAFPTGTLPPEAEPGDLVGLTAEQRHYLERVRRLRTGDTFLAFDGSGRLWQAKLAGEAAVLVQEFAPLSRELSLPLELAIAIPKGSGFDDIVRQVSELGVKDIVPLLTERTLVQPAAKRLQRWRAIAAEAAEQSERLQVASVSEPLTWQEWLQRGPVTWRAIATAREPSPHLLTALRQAIAADRSMAGIAIAIGPEGGWTATELELAHCYQLQGVSLGPRILRAVTAPVYAASVVAAVLEAGHEPR
jgi:16S rRNA (uracil1498-N3)-methyltransferase